MRIEAIYENEKEAAVLAALAVVWAKNGINFSIRPAKQVVLRND